MDRQGDSLSSEDKTLVAEFEGFSQRVSLIAILDHSGRAGNYFFQSVFDQHPEVLTCPWVQYTYSYVLAGLGEEAELEAAHVHQVLSRDSYFRLVYQDSTGEIAETIKSFGANPDALIDRAKTRFVFDRLLKIQPKISRRSAILASFFAYAKGIGREISKISYILVSDVLSMRTDTFAQGFPARIVPAMLHDFPQAKLISLERDPRATFASCRQQFVNSNGNMYSYKFGNYWQHFIELLSVKYTFDSCVYLFWLLYFAAGAKAMYRLKRELKSQLLVLKNEDLNLSFRSTIRTLADSLRVSYLREWDSEPYQPTNLGSSWKGKGAYNPLSQKGKNKILTGDSDEIARAIAGPNEYVTRRWRSRVGKNELAVIEYLFAEELRELNYEFLYFNKKKPNAIAFVANLWMPWKGEIPGVSWIFSGFSHSLSEGMQRLFYLVSFPLFYLTSRLQLLRMVYLKKYFQLQPVLKTT